MRKFGLSVAMAMGLMGSGHATAQDSSQDDVVVTARKPLNREEATRFVSSITAGRSDGQVARFEAPVCPMVIGFTPEISRQIVARIRKVAKAVGAEVAPEDCTGNVALVATPDGGALVKGMRATNPELLAGLETTQIRRLIDGGGPVRAWSATATVNEDGQRLSAPSSSNPMGPSSLNVKTASILNPSSKRVIDTSTVVIDSPVMAGKTVIQLADYVAMRALAKTRPVEGEAKVGTILTLFDPEASPPQSVTEVDVAYLKALYAMPGNRRVGYQISTIAKAVTEASTRSSGQ